MFIKKQFTPMSKSNPLTEQELKGFAFSRRTLEHIEAFRKEKGLQKDELSILDWGCGRGRAVLWLRLQGYSAFGVDIDPGPVENGMKLARKLGYGANTLQTLLPDGSAPFPDGFFNLIFSSQVLEHVSDLPQVAEELFRVTGKGGIGFHAYPARLHPVEAHLKMPFIHWLPKNSLRKGLINLFTRLGVEPRWERLTGESASKRTDAYYGYSIAKTYYRQLSDTEHTFQSAGFKVIFDSVNDPIVLRSLNPLVKLVPLKAALNRLLLTFIKVELLLSKP